jgi:hypothetical protein
MNVSITELRQRLFELADAVIQSGEPLLIDRKGVQLKLMRADEQTGAGKGRLARMVSRSIVVGNPLSPEESPARWEEMPQLAQGFAESAASYQALTHAHSNAPKRSRRKR